MGKIGIIIRREFNERVRKKSFIITTIVTPLFMVALMVVPVWMLNLEGGEPKEIWVVDRSGIVAPGLADEGMIRFIVSEKTLDEIRDNRPDIFGILVIGADVVSNPQNVQFYTYEPSTVTIEKSIADQIKKIIEKEKLKAYDIEDLDSIMKQIESPVSMAVRRIDFAGGASGSSSALSMMLAYLFGGLIYMFVMIYGGTVMQGVIEEKSSKVLEVMVSSVRPFELMMGKILGIASVAVTQFVIWAVLIVVVGGATVAFFAGDMLQAAASIQAGLPVDMAQENVNMDLAAIVETLTDPLYLFGMLGGFLLFFIGGYLFYGAMFAAVGSAVDNEKDTQNLQLPVTLPILLGLIMVVAVTQNPQGPIAFWFSMIPFFSPVVMMARLPYGVPGWEVILSALLLYASFVAMVWLAGRIYRVGIFMYGKKPSLAEIGKWVRYKS